MILTKLSSQIVPFENQALVDELCRGLRTSKAIHWTTSYETTFAVVEEPDRDPGERTVSVALEKALQLVCDGTIDGDAIYSQAPQNIQKALDEMSRLKGNSSSFSALGRTKQQDVCRDMIKLLRSAQVQAASTKSPRASSSPPPRETVETAAPTGFVRRLLSRIKGFLPGRG